MKFVSAFHCYLMVIIIYLEIASFYQMFGIRIFVSITVCDITGQ